MGISIPVGEFQCALRWLAVGDPQEMIVTLGIRETTETTATQMADIVYTAATTGTTSIANAAAMTTPYRFQGVTVQKQDDLGRIVWNKTLPITGTGSPSTILPNNCSLLVHKLTAVGGRTGRGRMYPPPYTPGEADIDAFGQIDSTTWGTVNNRWQQFWTNLINAPVDPVLFHETPSASTLLTGFMLDTRIATQRRRMRG